MCANNYNTCDISYHIAYAGHCMKGYKETEIDNLPVNEIIRVLPIFSLCKYFKMDSNFSAFSSKIFAQAKDKLENLNVLSGKISNNKITVIKSIVRISKQINVIRNQKIELQNRIRLDSTVNQENLDKEIKSLENRELILIKHLNKCMYEKNRLFFHSGKVAEKIKTLNESVTVYTNLQLGIPINLENIFKQLNRHQV